MYCGVHDQPEPQSSVISQVCCDFAGWSERQAIADSALALLDTRPTQLTFDQFFNDMGLRSINLAQVRRRYMSQRKVTKRHVHHMYQLRQKILAAGIFPSPACVVLAHLDYVNRQRDRTCPAYSELVESCTTREVTRDNFGSYDRRRSENLQKLVQRCDCLSSEWHYNHRRLKQVPQ